MARKIIVSLLIAIFLFFFLQNHNNRKHYQVTEYEPQCETVKHLLQSDYLSIYYDSCETSYAEECNRGDECLGQVTKYCLEETHRLEQMLNADYAKCQ